MTLLEEYTRVSRQHPCPVCGKCDWCLVRIGSGGQVTSVICPRTPSTRRWGNAGNYHALEDEPHRAGSRGRCVIVPERQRFDDLATALRENVDPDEMHRLALSLGVSVAALTRMGVGMATGDLLALVGVRWARIAWTFPMSNHAGVVVGIRVRLLSGRKLSVKGSKSAAFVPRGLEGACPLFIAEGESDTAALLTLGVDAIGRPGAMACEMLIAKYVRAAEYSEVVVVGDADPTGQAGAVNLASRLSAMGCHVRFITPPAKDVREWLRRGATPDALQALVADTPPVGHARTEVRP